MQSITCPDCGTQMKIDVGRFVVIMTCPRCYSQVNCERDEIDLLTCLVEEASLYYDDCTGKWIGKGLDYLTSVFEDEIGSALEMELVEMDLPWPLPADESYEITIVGPYWVSEEGGWTDIGYELPSSHVEWTGPVIVKKVKEE